MCCSLKLVSSRVDDKVFRCGLVRAKYDRVEMGWGHKIDYFLVQLGSEQKKVSHYRGRGAKNIYAKYSLVFSIFFHLA